VLPWELGGYDSSRLVTPFEWCLDIHEDDQLDRYHPHMREVFISDVHEVHQLALIDV
jgi:hypothetical protein